MSYAEAAFVYNSMICIKNTAVKFSVSLWGNKLWQPNSSVNKYHIGGNFLSNFLLLPTFWVRYFSGHRSIDNCMNWFYNKLITLAAGKNWSLQWTLNPREFGAIWNPKFSNQMLLFGSSQPEFSAYHTLSYIDYNALCRVLISKIIILCLYNIYSL